MKSDRMYIIKARVTDPDAHKEPCRVGDIEWRLVDDPDNPSYSYDYLTLEDLLYDNPGLPMVYVDGVTNSKSWTNYFVAYCTKEDELRCKILEAECEESAKSIFIRMNVEYDRIFFVRNFHELFE